MPAPGEHKTVQARILKYAQDIGWKFVPRAEAEARRGFDSDGATPEDRAHTASLYFGDLLHAQLRTFNPKYKEAEGALVGELQRISAGIAGNREFLNYLRNLGKFFCAEENRELDLTLIDYANPDRNVYEVTEEFYVHNGHYGTREDVVFLINGKGKERPYTRLPWGSGNRALSRLSVKRSNRASALQRRVPATCRLSSTKQIAPRT